MILKQRQSLPLDQKIVLSKRRIIEWYDHWDGDVYVSFSGGKDSTVLVDLVKNVAGMHDVPAVFCDTGLEYPEVREFALANADVIIKPAMNFKQVVEKYGYPVISKEQAQGIYELRHTNSYKLKCIRLFGKNGLHKVSDKWQYLIDAPFEISNKCCDVMKKAPFKRYEKETGRKSITGLMACESSLRTQHYEKYGCNAFDSNRPTSTPMGFWTEEDVLRYLKENDLEYAACYGDIVDDGIFEEHLITTGIKRTGCMFCMFGVHLEEEPNKFQRMARTHPKLYDYCINKLGCGQVLDWINVPY